MAVPDYEEWMKTLNGQQLAYRLYGGNCIDQKCANLGPCEQGWEPMPRAWFNEYDLRGTGEAGFEWNKNWTLQQNDNGAFSFAVKSMDSGIAIDLGGPLSDVFGYIVVLDDENHASYVLRKHVGSGQLVPGGSCLMSTTRKTVLQSSVDPNFRLDPDCVNYIWVRYYYGKITVGLGKVPEAGPVILRAEDPHPAPGIQQFGFGKWGIKSPEAVAIVKEILSFKQRYGKPDCRPYNHTPNAPHYFQCWNTDLYYR